MKPDEMVEVIQAFISGKDIQFKEIGSDDEWIYVKKPVWAFDEFDFRVKPDPCNMLFMFNGSTDNAGRKQYVILDERDCIIVNDRLDLEIINTFEVIE